MLRLLATVAIAAAMTRPVSGQQARDDALQVAARDSRRAAAAGLDTLRALARQNYRALGFTEAAQAAAGTLGDPFVEFFVRLDSLRAFSSGKNASSLLAGGDKVVYPVLAGGTPRSSIEVAKVRGGWRPVAYGGSSLAATLVRQREQLSKTDHRAVAEYFVVRVPALGLYFLGVNTPSGMQLTPIVDDPRARWKKGTSMPAMLVFTELVADARASNGLPM